MAYNLQNLYYFIPHDQAFLLRILHPYAFGEHENLLCNNMFGQLFIRSFLSLCAINVYKYVHAENHDGNFGGNEWNILSELY